MCDKNHCSCLRDAPARPIETDISLSVLSHIARACRSRGRLVAFLGCANAQLLAHAGLLHGSGGIVAGKGRARPSHRGSAMIGGLALLHKQFQEAGPLSWQAERG